MLVGDNRHGEIQREVVNFEANFGRQREEEILQLRRGGALVVDLLNTGV